MLARQERRMAALVLHLLFLERLRLMVVVGVEAQKLLAELLALAELAAAGMERQPM
jgi:hypothetical protein